jgi:N-acyl amino acid synthase FeeM
MEAYKPHAASDQSQALSIQRIAQLSSFAKRVTCRLARSHVEREAIFKLRYQTYLRAGLISQNPFERYIEPADHAANAYLMGLYIDRRLVSSLRLQVGSSTTPNFSSVELFPDVLEPLLRSNKTVVDMSCVAADAELARQYVWLPYLILRSWIMTAEHFQADYIAAAVRPPHQLFYQRALNCELHCELRQPPHHVASVGLVTLNFATSVKRLYEKFPFLRSAPSERQQLFEHDTRPSRSPARSLRDRRTTRLRAKE